MRTVSEGRRAGLECRWLEEGQARPVRYQYVLSVDTHAGASYTSRVPTYVCVQLHSACCCCRRQRIGIGAAAELPPPPPPPPATPSFAPPWVLACRQVLVLGPLGARGDDV